MYRIKLRKATYEEKEQFAGLIKSISQVTCANAIIWSKDGEDIIIKNRFTREVLEDNILRGQDRYMNLEEFNSGLVEKNGRIFIDHEFYSKGVLIVTHNTK